MSSHIHPTAIIEPGAVIGSQVTIEPYAVVKEHVTLKDKVTIKSHVYLDGYTTLHEGVTVWPGTTIGTKAQDLKFAGEKTFVEIGAYTEVRELVTINSSCQEGSTVKVGERCLIMTGGHIAHNCVVGNQVVMANGVMLGGHVEVGSCTIIGGMTPVHQFVRIGAYSMIGGLSRVAQDIPPYTIGGDIPFRLSGINLVGLKRRGFSLKERQLLTRAFKLTYRSNLSLSQALDALRDLPSSPLLDKWIDFCSYPSKRGLIDLRKDSSPVSDRLVAQ